MILYTVDEYVTVYRSEIKLYYKFLYYPGSEGSYYHIDNNCAFEIIYDNSYKNICHVGINFDTNILEI